MSGHFQSTSRHLNDCCARGKMGAAEEEAELKDFAKVLESLGKKIEEANENEKKAVAARLALARPVKEGGPSGALDKWGKRPIGVLATVARTWEAMRKPVVWQWRSKHTRPYNWATAGRSAEAAVWGQALRDEVARAKGKSCGAVLFDLLKAYEYVRLELVSAAGLEMEFPTVI